MAISRIRGEQIRQGVLVNQHIAANAAIEESKLSVNWASHYQEALETKKVVDYVQVNDKDVSGLTEFNMSTNGVLAGNLSVATTNGGTEGILADAPLNQVLVRDGALGEPILNAEGNEVYGRMVHDGVDFKVLFFSLVGSVETAFAMPAAQTVDFQYMERFNLQTVSELFAANEKFVDGAADITAHQNINQLANDLYGAGYTLDRDGAGNLTVSLKDQIANEAQDRADADQAILDNLAAQGQAGKGAILVGVEDAGNRFLGGSLEAVLAEIKDALDQLEADLASTEAGKGASKIGVEDAGAKFTATTVEGVLAELDGKIVSAANGGSTTQTEVDAARDSVLTGLKDSLDARLEADTTEILARLQTEQERATAAEQAVADDLAQEILDRQADVQAEEDRALAAETALDGRTDALEAEVQAARGSEASVDVRLDRALNENGTLKQGTKIHEHFRGRFQAVGGENEVLLSAFTSKKALPAAFHVGDDSLEVYINGQLQEEGLNYTEAVDGSKIVFDLGDGTVLVATDLVQIRFTINNAE